MNELLLLSYVGPAGIGALGVLLAVVVVLLIGAVGLVLYPIRLVMRHRRRLESQTSQKPMAQTTLEESS